MVLFRHAATAALLLLAFVLAADAASRPTVSDILQGGGNPSSPPGASVPKASVAVSEENNQEGYGGDQYPGNDYAHSVETKDVCLVEVQRSQCWEFGDHYDWKSDFALCQTAKNYYSTNSGVGFGAVGTTPPLNAIGSCEWHFDESSFEYVTDNIEKWGRVYATCFWNGNGEDCDGPLCHRMVFGLQGTYFFVYDALSYSGGPAQNYNTDAWPDCDIGVFRTSRQRRTSAKATTNTTSTPSAGRRQGRRSAAQPPKHAQQHTRTRSAAAVAATAGNSAGMQYYGKDNTMFTTDRPVYLGEAYVVNGMIFGLTGQTKEHWQCGGTFEWTMDFDMFDLASDGTFPGISAGLPWVTDKEMKMTFYKSPSYPSSYYSA